MLPAITQVGVERTERAHQVVRDRLTEGLSLYGANTSVGEAFHRGERMPVMKAFEEAGLAPFHIKPRDALASLSLNAVGYASAAVALHEAALAVRVLLADGPCGA